MFTGGQAGDQVGQICRAGRFSQINAHPSNPKLEKIQRTLIKLWTAVDDLERNRIADSAFLTWSKYLQEVVHDIEDVLVSINVDTFWKTAFIPFKFRSIAKEIKILNNRLDALSFELNDIFARDIF